MGVPKTVVQFFNEVLFFKKLIEMIYSIIFSKINNYTFWISTGRHKIFTAAARSTPATCVL